MGIAYHSSSTHGAGDGTRKKPWWQENRRFVPEERYFAGIDLDIVEIHNIDDEGEAWTLVACDNDDPCEHCGRLSAHSNCIIVAVDGACRGNGTAAARSSIGIFFGHESTLNHRALLANSRATNQVAELCADIVALERALEIEQTGIMRGLGQVVVKSDSDYRVKGMTEWIFKWEGNNYTNAKGTPVTNAEFFKLLQELVLELNKLEVEVLFWHVARARDQEADALANSALDGC